MLPVRRSRIIQPSLGETIAYGNPLAAGLLGAWPMNDGGGANVTDATGLYGNGAIVTPAAGMWQVGLQGIQYNNTVVTCINVPNNPSYPLVTGFNGTGEMTWFCLVRLDSLRNYYGLVTKTNGNTAAPFDAYVDSGGTLHAFWGNGSTSGSITATVSAGVWMQVAFTGNTVSQVAALYVNGALVATGTFTNVYDQGTALRIGDRNDGATSAFAKFALAMLWNRALSAAEIQMLAANPWQWSNARQPRGMGWISGGTSTFTLIPTGLPSAFAAGDPTLEYNQDIGPTGLASGFAGIPSKYGAGLTYSLFGSHA